MSAVLPPSAMGAFDGVALGSCALATFLLARLCARAGLGDGARLGTEARKLQGRPVPPVGGAAILLTYLLVGGLPSLEADRPGAVAALGWVFAVGTLDDWLARGLRPATKLVLQALALLPLGLLGSGAGLEGWGFYAACLVALNVVNTFDNADGAVASLATLGFAFASPLALALVLGFLPFNLDAERPGGGAARGSRDPGQAARRAPTAYLGDAGAFVLALLVMLHPVAWPVLWIPALDLARLAWVRTRAGSRPWIGDRRHLAHRLQDRLGSRLGVALVLVLVALPGQLGGVLEPRAPGALGWGLILGAGLYVALVLLLREPSAAASVLEPSVTGVSSTGPSGLRDRSGPS